MGPLRIVSEVMCHVVALRGPTRVSVTVEFALVGGTHFGKELLQQVEIWKAHGRGKIQNKPVVNSVGQRCLPLFKQLAPQTSLQDLSLESFLHRPTFNIEIVKGDNNDRRFERVTRCLYEPAFPTLPMRTADLPEACETFSHLQASGICIALILRDSENFDAIQGRVVTAEGYPFYFKPRVDMCELRFECELHILLRIQTISLAARLRVPRLVGIVMSGEDTIGMRMTLIDETPVARTLVTEV